MSFRPFLEDEGENNLAQILTAMAKYRVNQKKVLFGIFSIIKTT